MNKYRYIITYTEENETVTKVFTNIDKAQQFFDWISSKGKPAQVKVIPVQTEFLLKVH